jgi:D-tyrosyl-tRNA(Tyr) deacylase
MIALLQRVSEAYVSVAQERIAQIGRGVLVLVGIERDDGASEADRLLERILGYRVFPDAEGRMNLSVVDVHGGLLLVPQFTLAADTRKGMRPSFTPAASPEAGRRWFDYLLDNARQRYPGEVQSGQFGAEMRVALINDGPVTFWLQAGQGLRR